MSILQVNSLSELMSREYSPQRWLVDKMIAEDGLTILSAAPASFKTWLALDIALCVARGEKFLDTFATEQDNVLIIDEESGERSLQERFRQLGVQDDDLPIYYISRAGRKIDKAYLDDIQGTCMDKEIGLVIFDSLIRFHSQDENSSSEMSHVLEFFKKINDMGLACLILHHNRKSGTYYNNNSTGEAMRGSGDILAACDIQISLTRKGKNVTISQSKNRYCEEIQPITVEFDSSGGKSGFRFLGREKSKTEWNELTKTAILRYVNEHPGINKRQLEQGFRDADNDVSASKVSALLEELIKEKSIVTMRGPKNAQQLFVAGSGGETLALIE